ncbi:50S ribosomal protein L29 [Buchnera aphidicola (Nipponaphis monzeni)]|uniref:Large ribosomal subunit protein uL29 n=1 Tax=Buchnera aphidicola (Nipponaphis monzeni) TaxID=2495405 RepID=A0A455TAN9_9GAMM|nr:50S ribosomal protein L29 [Buchnera aphidicola]BBI01393.1 50S ribosomal protein L29 [Buchnera aphidicola (Nipponaphis monzeni)]
MKLNYLRKKKNQQLKIELLGLLKEQFNLRIKKVSGKLNQSHLLNLVRKNIARIKTILKESEILKKC